MFKNKHIRKKRRYKKKVKEGFSPFWSNNVQNVSNIIWKPDILTQPKKIKLNVKNENQNTHQTWLTFYQSH